MQGIVSRPGTAASRPGTAVSRPGTAVSRPGTACTAGGRPGTANSTHAYLCGGTKFERDDTWMQAISFITHQALRVSAAEVQGRLFLLDVSNPANARVLCAENGQVPMEYGPQCQFANPSHISAAVDGGLLVTDTGNHRIMHLSPGAAQWTVLAGGVGRGCWVDQLCFPRAAISLNDGSIVVADSNNHRVMRFPKGSKEGVVIAGGRGPGKHRGALRGPCGIAAAPNHGLLVADTLNNRVVHYSKGSSEGTPLLDQVLHNPVSLARTREGGVLIADAKRVIHFYLSTRRATSVMEGLKFPQCVTVTRDGHAIITEPDRCRVVYLSHKQVVLDLLMELSTLKGESLVALLRHDLFQKVMDFL